MLPKNDFTGKFLTPLKKLPKNVGDLGKLIVALKSCPKSIKFPNLVTLVGTKVCDKQKKLFC